MSPAAARNTRSRPCHSCFQKASDPESHICFGSHFHKALIIVHKNKTIRSVRANTPAQRLKITFAVWTLVRHGGRHFREFYSPFVKKKVDAPEQMILRTNLAVLAERCLKV